MANPPLSFRQLLDQLKPGPWGWHGNVNRVSLKTLHSGMHHLMGTDRLGFNGSQFTFQNFAGNRAGLISQCKQHRLYVPRAEHDQETIVDIDHPLAQLVRRIPEMVAEIDRLQKLLELTTRLGEVALG